MEDITPQLMFDWFFFWSQKKMEVNSYQRSFEADVICYIRSRSSPRRREMLFEDSFPLGKSPMYQHLVMALVLSVFTHFVWWLKYTGILAAGIKAKEKLELSWVERNNQKFSSF